MEVTLTQVWEKLLEIDGKMATKDQLAVVAGDLEKLAQSTAKGFAGVDARFNMVEKKIDNLNLKVDDVEKNLIDQIEDLARMTNGALAAKQDKFVYA